MAKKTFDELIAELTESAKKSTVFSVEKFEQLALAFANERQREFGYAKIKNGELVVEKSKPAEFFTKLIYEVLVAAGHDKQEAQNIAEIYQFKSFDGVYLALSEILFSYVSTGKSFRLPAKEDFVGTLYLRDRHESVSEHTNPQTGEKVKIKKEKHRTIETKSSAPDWLKARI